MRYFHDVSKSLLLNGNHESIFTKSHSFQLVVHSNISLKNLLNILFHISSNISFDVKSIQSHSKSGKTSFS